MIWPKYADCVVTGKVDSTCDDLLGTGPVPSEEERLQVEFLLSNTTSTGDTGRVALATSHAAVCWKDLSLWRQAIDVCSKALGAFTLDVKSIHAAVREFGFEAIKPRYVCSLFTITP